MVKNKFIIAILLVSLMLSVLVGCQAQNEDVPTEPSASSRPTELTEPSSEATEPSSEATDPTETVCPRTVEYFKSHLTPYMTYREVIEILGISDKNISNTPDQARRIWYLEEDYRIRADFFPIANQYRFEYLATEPTDGTAPDGSPNPSLYYLAEWNRHMEVYRVFLEKKNDHGNYRTVEVWFDYGYGPWWQ